MELLAWALEGVTSRNAVRANQQLSGFRINPSVVKATCAFEHTSSARNEGQAQAIVPDRATQVARC